MESKKMNYESVIILKGDLKQDEYRQSLNNIIERIKTLINIKKIDEIGLKKLAYEIGKNRNGYYSMTYKDNIEFGVPNQKMPPLLNFDLNFNVQDLYCDIKMEDGKYMSGLWTEYNDYNFTIYDKNNIVIGSSSNLKSNKNNIEKLSEELNYNKKKLQKIIEKGNSLYKEFYK